MRRIARAILPVNILLLAVGLTDLFSTLYWIHVGRAVEVNPIMAAVLNAGLGLFVGVKIFTLAAYVTVMEWYRRRRSAASARAVGNFTISAYAVIYTFCFCCVNRAFLRG